MKWSDSSAILIGEGVGGGGGGDGSLKDKGKHSLHTVSPPHPTHANPLFFGYDSLTNFSVS